ncbi:MAG: TRAP transporter small permease subunit [Thermodesulfobacteriota bacterium]|nr:TRAP transporter small permease subunit [Thermodesulfobacteriota bacterium]
MQGFLKFCDKLSEGSGKLFAWIIIILTGAMVYEVGARYIFNAPTIWAFDLSYMLYGTHFMMGAGYILYRKGNVRIDVFFKMFSPRTQAKIDLCLFPVFFFPALLVLLVVGTQHALYAWSIAEKTTMTSWRVAISPFKTVLPVATLILLLQGVAEFIRTWNFVRGKEK